MSALIMKILDTTAGEEFNSQISSYRKCMQEDVLRFAGLVEDIKQNVNINVVNMEQYIIFMKWGVRQLEYSFILDNIGIQDNMRVLDVGSGVTVFPNILYKMGCKVDALDPSKDWELANAVINEKYNKYYSTGVNYINDYVYSINGEGLYDRIVSVSVLEHLPKEQLKKTVEKMVNLLKPGGRLLITIDYCPRACRASNIIVEAIKKRNIFGRIVSLFLTKCAGKDDRTFSSGFSYTDFMKNIYPYLPDSGDIKDLKKQDTEATSYKRFWNSHRFDGCLYSLPRGYLSLGICCDKPKS